MKAHELLRHLTNDELDALVLHACRDDEVPEKIAGGVLTYQMIPLRRFARLPEETRKAWVRRTLRSPKAADLSLYVLSAALTRGKAAMIDVFLTAVELPHEGASLSVEGEIPEPPKKRLLSAIDELLGAYPSREVALYLHAFASQPDVHWKALDARLSSDARLAMEEPKSG